VRHTSSQGHDQRLQSLNACLSSFYLDPDIARRNSAIALCFLRSADYKKNDAELPETFKPMNA
jgi:hypothetical protein